MTSDRNLKKICALNRRRAGPWRNSRPTPCGRTPKQGHAVAQCNVGIAYYHGVGFGRDFKKAFGWFLKAAEQGNADAQFNLAGCFYDGLGTEQDYKAAARPAKSEILREDIL